MITNIKIKVSRVSRCADCLAIKSFVDKIKDKYELETIINQLLLDWILKKQNMLAHCVMCGKKTWNLNPKIFKRKNGRLIIQPKCADCGIRKSRLVKDQEAKGLLSNLEIKTPLSKIPLLNVLFWVYKYGWNCEQIFIGGW